MMQPARLARIVAEAEGIWLRSMLTRIATRVGMAAAAFLFMIGALAFGLCSTRLNDRLAV